MSRLSRLMHIIDSSLPTGSFAYSLGLESSITFELISTQSELRHYLYSFLQQIVSADFPFINSCFLQGISDLDEQLLMMGEAYDAFLLTPTIYKSSLIQAKNWNKLLGTFYPEAALNEIEDWFSANDVPFHYLFAFSLGLKRAGFSLEEVREMHLHIALRDQISAGIRLGFIGPMEAHKLQHDFYSIFETLLEGCKDFTYLKATRSAFLLDVAQVYHEDIYSKLFQN